MCVCVCVSQRNVTNSLKLLFKNALRKFLFEKVRQFYIYISICIYIHLYYFMGFPSDSVVKNPPAMQETRVQSLGQEDPLEEELATQSRILGGKSQG